MKPKNYSLLVTGIALIATLNSKAQLSLTAGVDYNLIAGTGIKTPSINVGGSYGLGDGQRAIIGNFKYFIPGKYEFTTTGYALSSSTDPQSIEISVKDKVSFIAISAGVRNYFGDGSIDDGGFFGSAAGGLVLGKEELTFSSYDKNLYSNNYEETTKIGDFFAIFGIGYDFSLNDNMFLGAELPIAITTQGINSRDGSSSPIPIIISPGISFRYMLGK